MRLPHLLLESKFFLFSNVDELTGALGDYIDKDELADIGRLSNLNLPPVTSKEVLATMLGLNPGIIWSYQFRSHRHYRSFPLKKGNGIRQIDAPKVGLKIIQKWLSVRFQEIYSPPTHVYGFVQGRSHIKAASVHCGADWVYSSDIKDFFPSTPQSLLRDTMLALGYKALSADMIAALCCFRGSLAQGAPSSPILSNILFSGVDTQLETLASKYDLRLTRYADDIVFSGSGHFPIELPQEIVSILALTPWKISPDKTTFSQQPGRLKVHGLLVHGHCPRMTKGYRNRVRAFRHMLANDRIRADDLAKIRGHIRFEEQIKNFSLQDC